MIFLPQPSSLSYGEGTFTIHYDSRIFLDSESPAELFSAAQLLQQEIETQTGFRPAICRRHQPVGSHLIYLTASPELSREAYTLAVTPENITICGSLESGVLYGVQTLRQMIRQAGGIVEHAAFVISLPELGGEERLTAMGVKVLKLVDFPGH